VRSPRTGFIAGLQRDAKRGPARRMRSEQMRTAAVVVTQSDYPDAQEFVAQYVLKQPSAAEMLDRFTRSGCSNSPPVDWFGVTPKG
jgi:hypothetical protein